MGATVDSIVVASGLIFAAYIIWRGAIGQVLTAADPGDTAMKEGAASVCMLNGESASRHNHGLTPGRCTEAVRSKIFGFSEAGHEPASVHDIHTPGRTT